MKTTKNMLAKLSSCSFLSLMFFLLLFQLLVGCSNDSGPEQDATDKAIASASIAADYFSATEMNAIIKIKNHFEEGLRQSFEKRTIGYAYTQNALRMRLNLIEEDNSEMPFPFNGDFSLLEFSEDVEKLPFFSKKCGFLAKISDEQVNYYCLAINENYFNYLAVVSDGNGLIDGFVNMYKDKKSITPEYRQEFLMNGMEKLDLNNWDHQFFYMLQQCWRNEELIAYFKAEAQ